MRGGHRLARHGHSSGAARRLRALLAVGALTLLCGMPLALVGAGGLLGAGRMGVPAVYAAARDLSPTPTPTATPTPTPSPTPTPLPPTLTLLSPSSHAGPVGAHLTVAGGNWGGGVVIGAMAGGLCAGAPASWTAIFGTVQATASGTLTYSFIWPTSLANQGAPYAICASSGAGAASVAFSVRAASPPTLSLSASAVRIGQNITVSGANFVGVPGVALQATAAGGVRLLATLIPAGDGSFSYPYIPITADVGGIAILAASQSENGATPALQASASLTVLALVAPTNIPTTAPTATPAPTPTAVATAAVAVRSQSISGGLLLALAGGVLLISLLLLGGAALLLIGRRRGRDAASLGQPGGGAETSWGGAPSAERLAASAAYRRAGMGMPARDPGASAGWGDRDWADDDDDGPGPDWHPRSMTAHRARVSVDAQASDPWWTRNSPAEVVAEAPPATTATTSLSDTSPALDGPDAEEPPTLPPDA